MKKKYNISIVGQSNTGKSTLINYEANLVSVFDLNGKLILSTNNKTSFPSSCEETPNLEYLINKFEKTDIVLVEGYKNSKIPKIEVRRYEKYDYKNEDTIKNIIAIN